MLIIDDRHLVQPYPLPVLWLTKVHLVHRQEPIRQHQLQHHLGKNLSTLNFSFRIVDASWMNIEQLPDYTLMDLP
jgi:hypothetical protein